MSDYIKNIYKKLKNSIEYKTKTYVHRILMKGNLAICKRFKITFSTVDAITTVTKKIHSTMFKRIEHNPYKPTASALTNQLKD